MSDVRLQREADFHNHRFADDTRAANRFYVAAGRAFDRYKALVREAGAGAGRRVLEYGCGPKPEALGLAAEGAHVDGIDISQVAVEQAAQRASARGVGDRCTFQVMNAEALAFADGSFDLVCGSGILHHLDLPRAYREVARVLKPGGRAVFLEPLGHNPIINWYRSRTPEMRTPDEHPLLARDFEEARRYFSRVEPEFFGLSVIAAVPLNRFRLFQPVHRVLDQLDGLLLASWSPLRWGAWMTVVALER
jgi:ubiquinone/menaquinone biosynthesis C-methylase UbiE